MSSKAWKCARCDRRYRYKGDWNCTVRRGVVLGVLCPQCQSPEENAEAILNEATLTYLGTDPFGRLIARPKVSEG